MFQPAALKHWWRANPTAVEATIASLFGHACKDRELWQLTFDVILLGLYELPDWHVRQKLAEQVLTCLSVSSLNNTDRFYGCRCMAYCEPFPALYDLHSEVMRRLLRKSKKAKRGMLLYIKWAAQTAIYRWSLNHVWWYYFWCGQTVEMAARAKIEQFVNWTAGDADYVPG